MLISMEMIWLNFTSDAKNRFPSNFSAILSLFLSDHIYLFIFVHLATPYHSICHRLSSACFSPFFTFGIESFGNRIWILSSYRLHWALTTSVPFCMDPWSKSFPTTKIIRMYASEWEFGCTNTFLSPSPSGSVNKLHSMYDVLVLYIKYSYDWAFCTESCWLSYIRVHIRINCVCVSCGRVLLNVFSVSTFACICELHSKAINIRICILCICREIDALHNPHTHIHNTCQRTQSTFENAFSEICRSVFWPMKCSKTLGQMGKNSLNVKHEEPKMRPLWQRAERER